MINFLAGVAVGLGLHALANLVMRQIWKRLGKPVNDRDADKLREIAERNGK